jgi:predicted acylesterase/phospholipase RssA
MPIKLKELYPIDFEVPDVAFGISGGSLGGAYPAGVLTAYGQIGLVKKCNLIMGTSVGSADASAAAKDWKLLQALWEQIGSDSSKVWKGDLKNMFGNVWGALFNDSILDPAPFYGLLENTNLFGNMTLEELAKINDIEIIIPAIDNNTHQLVYFTSFGEYKNMKVSDVVEASTAIPVGLKSKPIKMPDGTIHWFSDGGAGANVPFVAVHKYNKAFPDNKVKKLILIFCGADKPAADIGKEYKLARDVGINQIGSSISVQEQVSEDFAEMITDYGVMDVCAVWHKGGVGDSMIADSENRINIGYEDGCSMMVWDYKLQCEINLIDFLKRK